MTRFSVIGGYQGSQTYILAAVRGDGDVALGTAIGAAATASALGIRLDLLLHQGRPAWKLWFDLEPVVTPELRARMERSI